MNPIIISIDGNIGAGKSTFLNQLKQNYPNFNYIDEPVDIWTKFTNDENQSLLELYYKDKSRWAYTFQNCVFLTRVLNINRIINEWKEECKINPEKCQNNIFITERFIDTDVHIFAKMLHDDGFINKMEWDMYIQWYEYLITDCKLDGIIYIDTNPELCRERIKIRGRNGESNISLDFLNKLCNYHDIWIKNVKVPVLKLTEYNENINYDLLIKSLN